MYNTQFTFPIFDVIYYVAYDVVYLVVYDVVYDVGISNKVYVRTISPSAKCDESVPVTPKKARQIFKKSNFTIQK